MLQKITLLWAAILSATSAASAAPSAPANFRVSVNSPGGPTGPWSLTPAQRRQYLGYYGPIIFKNADEAGTSAPSHAGWDWITNFDFDRDGIFKSNRFNWQKIGDYVANPAQAAFANWKIRPTLYSAILEFMEGTNKSAILLYHVYHAHEFGSIHDWERIEVRIDNLSGTPGSANEKINYVVVTQHSTHKSRLYPSTDLNFLQTARGKHPLIWQAKWSESSANGPFYRQELHFVETPWTTIAAALNGASKAEVDVNGSSTLQGVHYIFVPDSDPDAAALLGAAALTQQNANSLAAKVTATPAWSGVKRINYEFQDLADILPSHADCSACGGAACGLENGWKIFSSHWEAPTVEIKLENSILTEGAAVLVPASSASCPTQRFYLQSLDQTHANDGAEGYPDKHWFWGAYKIGGSGETSFLFDGNGWTNPTTGRVEKRPCGTASYGHYWCQHDYYAHDGATSSSSSTEYGKWLPAGWQRSEAGGFDGRWEQLFDDRPSQ